MVEGRTGGVKPTRGCDGLGDFGSQEIEVPWKEQVADEHVAVGGDVLVQDAGIEFGCADFPKGPEGRGSLRRCLKQGHLARFLPDMTKQLVRGLAIGCHEFIGLMDAGWRPERGRGEMRISDAYNISPFGALTLVETSGERDLEARITAVKAEDGWLDGK